VRRRNRILLAILAGLGSIGVVTGLVSLGSASEGPLTAAMRAIGSGVSQLESAVVRRVRGTSRADRLAEFQPLRTSPDALRDPDRLLLGAYDGIDQDGFTAVLGLEQAIGHPLAILQIYSAWGDAPEQAFPRRMAEAIHELGSVPMITWEPWLTTFENRLHPGLPLRTARDEGGLAAIARGEYDFYIDAWATAAAAFGAPILARFAHEMNDPYRYPWGPQNNKPQDFIAAWRHVVDRFRMAGADNVVWVWSPHVAYEGFETYWPGGEYVDWVATGALNYGTVAYWSQWWTFDQIFGKHYDFLAGLGKPLMIAEFGSLAVGGDRAEWYRAAFADLTSRMPQLKALLFFDANADATVTRQSVDWSFVDDSAVVRAVRGGLEAEETEGGERR
jgi:hypothetical protein